MARKDSAPAACSSFTVAGSIARSCAFVCRAALPAARACAVSRAPRVLSQAVLAGPRIRLILCALALQPSCSVPSSYGQLGSKAVAPGS
jgi:hypothetical protein